MTVSLGMVHNSSASGVRRALGVTGITAMGCAQVWASPKVNDRATMAQVGFIGATFNGVGDALNLPCPATVGQSFGYCVENCELIS